MLIVLASKIDPVRKCKLGRLIASKTIQLENIKFVRESKITLKNVNNQGIPINCTVFIIALFKKIRSLS